MTSEVQPSAMRRKAGAGRPPPEIGRLTASKAVRAAVVQAADEVAGLAATAGLVDESRTTLGPFIDDLPEPALLALVEGPGARFGLVVLDAQVLAALIEMQTTGRVVPRPADPRPPTRTDAIMCADFIDRLLELVETRAGEAELDVAPALTGFRYGLALSEARAIMMTLEDIPYRLFRFEVDLGRGAKSGGMQILLPHDPPGKARSGGAEAEAFADAMRAHVLETRAELSATLMRRRMSLAEVARFEVGTLVTLPRSALQAIAVEALDGTVVATGRLGQVNGHRAVRLTLQGSQDEDASAGAPPLTLDVPKPAPPALAAGHAAPGGSDATAGADDLAALGDPGQLGGLGDLGALGEGSETGDLADLGDLAALGDLTSLGE